MLKGMFDDVVGAMIVVVFFVLLLLVLATGFAKTEAVMAPVLEKLNSMDAAHLVKACLKEDGLISEEKLDDVKAVESGGKGIGKFCGLGAEPFIKVSDLEGLRKWSFGKEKDGKKHSVFFSLLRKNGEIHVGEINAIV